MNTETDLRFIGGGRMGQALLSGLLDAGLVRSMQARRNRPNDAKSCR
jgi:pyrroline-5-carboxylate reductase